jgi:hypothetical protein
MLNLNSNWKEIASRSVIALVEADTHTKENAAVVDTGKDECDWPSMAPRARVTAYPEPFASSPPNLPYNTLYFPSKGRRENIFLQFCFPQP